VSSMFSKIGSWFAIHDDEHDEAESFEAEQAGPKRNVVPLTEAGRRPGPSVAVFAPRGFSDVTEIADALRARQVAIVNLQGADRSLLQRVVDFTSGVAYTIDGRIQKLAEAIYLVVPAGVTVNSANLREQITDDGMLDLSARFGNNTRNER
jgi:cell division inhibitor SepF